MNPGLTLRGATFRHPRIVCQKTKVPRRPRSFRFVFKPLTTGDLFFPAAEWGEGSVAMQQDMLKDRKGMKEAPDGKLVREN